MPSECTILAVPLSSQLGGLGLALRRDVFVFEQHVPPEIELDADDLTATHVVALEEGDVVGVLRLLFLAEHVKIGRVAVAGHARGRGIASAMLRFAMHLARARGETRFYLAAQTDKVAFYERFGFSAFGSPFEDGGMPHLAMKTY